MKRLLPIALLFASFSTMSASPYDKELLMISGKIRSLTMYVERGNNRSLMLPVRKELLEATKSLHRISEEAQSTNLSFLERGQPIDQSLNYADAISRTLDLSGVMLDSYIQTGDENFIKFSKEQLDISRKMMSKQP
ncbi:hypothetical protein [Serratia marcescens]|uniref:hypothetical protein n=1 Tax=Serratia marcescens TaxID=615 RepID=UPI00128CD681|nr:hypothetical protein [Serratia marcescens]